MHIPRKHPPPPWQRHNSAPQHPLGPARRRFASADASGAEPPARYRRAFDGAGDPGVTERRHSSSDRGVRMSRRRPSVLDRIRRNPVRHGVIGLTVAGVATPLAIARDNQARTNPSHEREALPSIAAVPDMKLTDRAVGEAWREARLSAADARAKERDGIIQRNVQRHNTYSIPRDLAEDIYDIALAEKIDPDVAFGLVRTESAFKNSATSHVGAIGLTQLMPATARWIKPDVTSRDLRDQRTNLRIGFKYLNDLMSKYEGDTELALLAYNRGPGTVDRILKRGGDPDNGYPDMVLRGATPDATPGR